MANEPSGAQRNFQSAMKLVGANALLAGREQVEGLQPNAHGHVAVLKGSTSRRREDPVSIGANLRYGISLGHEPVDKSLYAAASVAADAFKIMLPLLMLRLWARRHPLWRQPVSLPALLPAQV